MCRAFWFEQHDKLVRMGTRVCPDTGGPSVRFPLLKDVVPVIMRHLNLLLAASIVIAAVAAFFLNRARLLEGPVVIRFAAGHGLHLLDAAFILVELVLVTLLLYSSRRE